MPGVYDNGTDNGFAIRARALQAFTVNQAYLALPSPTAADAITQVGRLTREVNALLRLLFGKTDDISDT